MADTLHQLIDRIIADSLSLKVLLGPPVVQVTPGSNVQAELDAAPEGAIVSMAPGDYQGPFYLRKPGTLRGAVGARVLTGSQGLVVEGPDVTVENVEVTGNANDIVWIKQSASNSTFRNAFIHGDPVLGAKRGIQANGRGLTLEDSIITDIFRVGQESAGIGAWDSPGPFTIRRNLIQAASINFLFGGADPSSEANIPADILIEDNTLSKKLEWRGKGYAAKNLGELKIAKRAIIRNNTFQYSWVEGQTGFGLVLSVRNQSGTAPYSTVEDVLVENNTIKNVGTAVSILGQDTNFPSQTMKNVTFRNNIFDGIDRIQWGGRGATFEILRGPENLTIEGTQVLNAVSLNSALFFGAGTHPAVGLVVRSNQFVEGSYGIIGDGTIPGVTIGLPTITAFAPGFVWETNAVQKSGIRTVPWPTGTTFI